MSIKRPLQLTFAVFLLGFGVSRAESLHEAIDVRIATGAPDHAKKASPLAGDAEFLRRIYLDLTGTIPPAAQVRDFLDDKSSDKRAKLIDRLLASPEHARQLGYVFDNLLMDRRPGKFVPPGEWFKFLVDTFAANKPYDVLVREILSADGADAKNRAPARFFLDRDAEPHLLTRDIARIFLGTNLTCCQCHDHPLVSAYKQDHYYGLYSFVSRSQVVPEAKPVALGEKADGDTTFTSVFDPSKAVKTATLRVPGGTMVAEPKLEKGKEYKVAPAKGVRGIPQFSRRAQLAPNLTSSRQFARNTANRLWAMMMGRGLVHPLDFDHKANPPSHPELLDKLTDELIAHKFDLRWFLKELALSQTYQRSSVRSNSAEPEPEKFLSAALKPLSPEQLAWSLMHAVDLPAGQRNDGTVRSFVNTFGGKPGEPDAGFQATLDQTLFVSNGPTLRQWLAPGATNLTSRLAKAKDDAAAADELFVSVLTRRPSADEVKLVAEYLKGRDKDRPAALQELAWALLASAEFRFNH
jgi:Protein of unknown function (DUF1549)/Protein of unknown function (DUF1553)